MALEKNNSSFTGINLGIGLMLESIFKSTDTRVDEERKIPNKVDIAKYKKYYVSLQTYISTFLGSYDKMSQEKFINNNALVKKFLLEDLLTELYVFLELFKETKTEVIFYIADYKELANKDMFRMSDPNTKSYAMDMIRNDLVSHVIQSDEIDVVKFKKIPANSDNVLITTSNALDLLNVNKIRHLHLLEPHTGKLKNSIDFPSKYYKSSSMDLNQFPFNETLLYIFRDKNGSIVNGFSSKEKTMVYNLGLKKKWRPYNIGKDVRVDLKDLQDKELWEKIKKLPKIF